MSDEKDPGIVAWLWTPSTSLRRIAFALCIGVILIACALWLSGCASAWHDPTCDADGDCVITPAGGGAFGAEIHDPEHVTGAGWVGLTYHFDAPWGHKLPGER